MKQYSCEVGVPGFFFGLGMKVRTVTVEAETPFLAANAVFRRRAGLQDQVCSPRFVRVSGRKSFCEIYESEELQAQYGPSSEGSGSRNYTMDVRPDDSVLVRGSVDGLARRLV